MPDPGFLHVQFSSRVCGQTYVRLILPPAAATDPDIRLFISSTVFRLTSPLLMHDWFVITATVYDFSVNAATASRLPGRKTNCSHERT